MSPWSDEETDNSLPDGRNFYKVEKCTRDGRKIEPLLYAGNDLEKARELFAHANKPLSRISEDLSEHGGAVTPASEPEKSEAGTRVDIAVL